MSDVLPAGAHIWVPALIILAGMIGVVIPVLPGLFLTLLGVALWAWEVDSTPGWVVLGVCALWFVLGLAGQYLVPGRRLRSEGVRTGSLLLAVVGGLVGMVVIPVVGFFVGFVLVLYLLAWLPRRDTEAAWRRTKSALRAVATSIGIELVAAVCIAVTWVAGVVLTT